jgi:hypothetical protein
MSHAGKARVVITASNGSRTASHQIGNLGTYSLFQGHRSGAEKLLARKLPAQTHQKNSLWIMMQKVSAHSVDLPFNGVACDGPPGPAFGHHGTYPHVLHGKQQMRRVRTGWTIAVLLQRFWVRLPVACTEPVAVQNKMFSPGDDPAGQNRLELWPGFQALHKTRLMSFAACRSIRLPGACGLWRDVQQSRLGRPAFSCGSENRACGRA